MADLKVTVKKKVPATVKSGKKDGESSVAVKKEDTNATDKLADPKEPIDLSISRHMDPVPKEIRQLVRRQANKFIRQQRLLESSMDKRDLRQRQEELTMRRNFDIRVVHEIMEHPMYARMMRAITDEMIKEEQTWRRFKPNKFIKDTESSRRRIQNAVPLHVMEYAIKYSKKPWRYPGKSKIKTKFYEEVDWMDDPYVVLEEKTEHDFKQETVKA